ncbi:GL15496 [Drosophila persimilis]|uniref:GL15496 n=1 Tax=Drosophila persimilis TaxID=7234 RepID=B4GPX5_DROPE|nr:GL15496 [Drosophila persimilis]
MPAKRQKGTRKTSVQSLEAAAPVHPEPPNVFLYIQLANICPTTLPKTIHPLEIHLRQGDSLIIKCEEHYNTEGIIRQNEFNTKPTFTLVFQQDNLDRINHAANNPLLVMFYMRQSDITSDYNGEEAEDGEFIDDPQVLSVASIFDDGYDEHREIDYHPGNEQLVLLSAGYLDVIKLFGHHRSMIRECLYLYPVPDVPQELRTTVHTDWDLYTLLPIAKELTFTNMAFITFESIYNLKGRVPAERGLHDCEDQLSLEAAQPGKRIPVDSTVRVLELGTGLHKQAVHSPCLRVLPPDHPGIQNHRPEVHHGGGDAQAFLAARPLRRPGG